MADARPRCRARLRETTLTEKGDAMIRVHHLNNSRSQRILWMLEELGAPYEIVHYERDATTNLAPPELKAIHPLGKSPVIEDPAIEEPGAIIAETGAIIEYLAEKFGRFMPERGSPAYRQAIYWLHFGEGTAMLPVLLKLYLSRIDSTACAAVMARADEQMATQIAYLEAEMAGKAFFVGDELTVADFMMSFPVEAMVLRGGLGPDQPNLWGYVRRIQARPAYVRGIEKGGPYRFQLPSD